MLDHCWLWFPNAAMTQLTKPFACSGLSLTCSLTRQICGGVLICVFHLLLSDGALETVSVMKRGKLGEIDQLSRCVAHSCTHHQNGNHRRDIPQADAR